VFGQRSVVVQLSTLSVKKLSPFRPGWTEPKTLSPRDRVLGSWRVDDNNSCPNAAPKLSRELTRAEAWPLSPRERLGEGSEGPIDLRSLRFLVRVGL
jgi:hypothetical protein